MGIGAGDAGQNIAGVSSRDRLAVSVGSSIAKPADRKFAQRFAGPR